MTHSDSPCFLFFSHASLGAVRVLKEDNPLAGGMRSRRTVVEQIVNCSELNFTTFNLRIKNLNTVNVEAVIDKVDLRGWNPTTVSFYLYYLVKALEKSGALFFNENKSNN
jgi:hypothetical protein